MISGILPALITPMQADGRLDRRAIRRLVEHVLRARVDGVLVLGSSGEGPSLNDRMRHETIDVVAEVVAGRCPIVVGAIHSSLSTARDDIGRAARSGAAAALASPPYFGVVRPEDVGSYYRRLAETSQIPLLAYNIPAFTHVTLSPPLVAQLAEEGAIIGLKDSSRDFDYFQQILALLSPHPGFDLLTGSDSLLFPALAAGASGGITVGGNIAPAWCVGIRSAVAEGRWSDARELQEKLVRLTIATRRGVFPAGTKAALSLLGLCGDVLAPPNPSVTKSDRLALERDLRELGIGLSPARS